MTELHEAAASGDSKTLEYLLLGGDIDTDSEDWDWGKRTALHVAASQGHLKCTRLLLSHGSDPSMRTSSGWTPAHFAAECGYVAILKTLIIGGAPVNIPDNSGDKPIRIAEIYGHKKCVEIIERFENGEDISEFPVENPKKMKLQKENSTNNPKKKVKFHVNENRSR